MTKNNNYYYCVKELKSNLLKEGRENSKQTLASVASLASHLTLPLVRLIVSSLSSPRLPSGGRGAETFLVRLVPQFSWGAPFKTKRRWRGRGEVGRAHLFKFSMLHRDVTLVSFPILGTSPRREITETAKKRPNERGNWRRLNPNFPQ